MNPEKGWNKDVPGIPLSEWLVGTFGLLLTLSLLVYLAYEAISGSSEPPNIMVEVKEVRSNGEGYLLLFTARNDGGETAANVLVVGELIKAGTVLETSQVTLSYVPTGSERNGGLFFNLDPAVHTVTIEAQGYTQP